jgi:HNH endonuclease
MDTHMILPRNFGNSMAIDRTAEFWSKVDKGPHPKGCWLWTGYIHVLGYGIMGDHTRAHRFSYELHKGSIPKGLIVRHFKCHTRACVRPSHLKLGTHQDNMGDKVKAGRQAKGETHGMRLHPERAARGDQHYARRTPEKVSRGEKHYAAKLTTADVLSLRRLAVPGDCTHAELALKFGISRRQASAIIRRTKWKHI